MKRFAKIISLVLTLAMVFSVMSVGAWATIVNPITGATIKVVDENGNALKDVTVYVDGADSVTDENGLVALGELEDGLHPVVTELSGYFANYVGLGINGGHPSVDEEDGIAYIDDNGNVVIVMTEIPEITFEIVKNVELAAGSEEAPETTFTFEVKCDPNNVADAEGTVVLNPEDFTFTTEITVPAGEPSASKKVTLDINDENTYRAWVGGIITVREENDGAENWTYDEAILPAGENGLNGSIFTFTNTYNKPAEVPPVVNEVEPEKDKIIVKKIWVGDDEKTRPEEITVQLYKNGKKYEKPVKLSADEDIYENWRHVWDDVREDEDTVWSVKELNVPDGYSVSIEQRRSNYFIITNTLNEKANPETGASDFVGAAVALAVCSTVCGAALMLKRK